ncbi:hypothetical protein AcV5_005894 [Taiwanofungus camphoratus]|nr:hypothetical protein AcV5_005894 [Antrodia cinnamomea]
MASSLSLPSTTSTSSSYPSLHAPPPSQDSSVQQIAMPNVFVIPPEEELEENPPWCYFDAEEAAKNPLSTTPDIDALDTALHFHQQTNNRAPAFHRSVGNDSQETVVMPRKGRNSLSRDSISDFPREVGRNRVMDEEIVEVVKVRRNEGLADIGEMREQTIKKSRTFRARASQAFKSIKNVGKGGRRPVSSASTTWQTGENARQSEEHLHRETLPRSSTPNLSRRKSLMLSHLFTFSQGSRPSAASPDVPVSTMSSSPSAMSHRHSIPADMMFYSPSHPQRLRPSPSLEDCMDTSTPVGEGPISTTPSLSKKKSFRHRLSVLELQRLFTLHSSSHSSSASASELSDNVKSPDVIVDVFAASDSSPEILDSPRTASSLSTPSSTPPLSAGPLQSNCKMEARGRDTSLEMQLDSLHFDSLHFDPNEF